MAVGGNVVIDQVANTIYAKASEQSWFRRNANFVTTVGGFVATVLAWAASQPFADNPSVQTAILLIGFILTCLGVRVTPNGWSNSQLAKIAAIGPSVATDVPLLKNVPSTVDFDEVKQKVLADFKGKG